METTYSNLKTLKRKHGEAEFQAEIPLATFAWYESQELARMGQHVQLPGFRKGKAPEHLLREHINLVALFEDSAEAALHAAVREIMNAEKLEVLGVPQLTVEKLEPGEPIDFKVRFALMPEIELPDYKKIGQNILARKDPVTVTDAEMREALEHLRKMAARVVEKPATPAAEAEGKKKEELPELTDELVQKLGNFKTVADLETQLKQQLIEEKEQRAQDAKRDEVVKNIVDHAKMELPELLVEQELQKFQKERDHELEHAGLKLEDYLKDVKKTEKDLEKEERARVEARLKTSLVFNAIQEKENIEPDEKAVVVNFAFLKRRYPHEDPASLRRSAEAFNIQEKLFKLFEPAAAKPEPAEPEHKKEEPAA